MIPAPKPANEAKRLSALYEYNILDTIPEDDYDDITRIAAEICDMPISLISIIDNDRQWFKSRIGLDPSETHRDLAFCAHAILDPNEMFVVPDPSKDERFADNPLVTGYPGIGFYAGVPLVNEEGDALGTLCVIDNKPNKITQEQKATLMALARQIVAYLEVRKKNLQLSRQKEELELLNKELDRFAYVVAHDIKSPCGSLAMATDLIRDIYGTIENKEGAHILDLIGESSQSIINMVDGILKHTLTVNNNNIEKEYFLLGDILELVGKLLPADEQFSLTCENPSLELFSSRYMLLQIFLNLCSNAIKYNDKERCEISVSAGEQGNNYIFSIQDNGIGIRAEDQKKIFELFGTLGITDRNQNKGTGIGLATVHRLVHKLGGSISLESTPGSGSSFTFTIRK